MKQVLPAIISLLFLSSVGFSQNIGIGTNTPHPSAKLEVSSNNSGFLPPRMTTLERNGINNPAAGLMIYNTTTDCLEVFGRGKWNSMYCVPIDSTLLTDIDGRTYPTVKICDQTWMAKNLDVARYRNGDIIPQVTNPSDWANLATGAWCWYNNDSANGAIYGRLYNWYAVNDPRGLAPEGWHVPSDGEWTILTDCLGGTDSAGGKMKDTGTRFWNIPNAYSSNSSGFSGLPGGYTYDIHGSFDLGIYAGFWGTDNPVFRSRFLSVSDPAIHTSFGQNGLSVRCIKNSNIPTTTNDGLVAYYPFNGNANDESGNGNNGTVNGATLTTDRFGNSNKAYSFDGDQDYILIPNSGSLNPNAITFSIWAYFNNGNCGILSKSDATTNNNYGYSIIYNFQNQNSGLFTGWNTSGACTYPTPNEGYTFGSSGIIQISTWKHILISINEFGECKQYINGIQTDTYNHIPLNSCNSNLSLLHIGRQWLEDPCWMNGKLDDIRIYNRALTQEEITYLATH